MKSFLVGLGIGVGLGMLFAPGSGDRTRRNTWRSVTRWRDKLSQQLPGRGQAEEHSTRRSEQREEQDASGSSKKRQAKAGGGDSINSLSRDELMTVNGIGPVLADRIISGRPYSSTRDLVNRGIIAQGTLEELERQFGSKLKEPA